jgi:hypothetical protein
MTMRRILKVNELSTSLDYETIVTHLTQYQKQGENRRWEEYRVKIPPPVLKIWGEILTDCRRNGFINPHVWDGKIMWNQIIATGPAETTDLCTLCDRVCQRREDIDTGEGKRMKTLDNNYEEPKPCWIVNRERS